MKPTKQATSKATATKQSAGASKVSPSTKSNAKTSKPASVVTATKRPVGRPKGNGSKYTPELAKEICDRISKGEPLTQICRDNHMPDRSNVHIWREEHPEFSRHFARARDEGYDAIADDCVRIADDKIGDPDSSSRRVRVETRLKLLAKWDPKRYGERLDQNITIDPGPKTLESLRERALAIGSIFARNRGIGTTPEIEAERVE